MKKVIIKHKALLKPEAKKRLANAIAKKLNETGVVVVDDSVDVYVVEGDVEVEVSEDETLNRPYEPVCPRGYTDCVCDPAYIKHHHPEWYKELYGDKTPEEAIHEENGCYDRFIDDPDEDYYCYDNEDK